MTPTFAVIVPVAPGRRPLVLASLERLSPATDAPEVLLRQGRNPSRCRNEAVRLSRAPILAFTDDDCVVAPDWLARAAAFFQAHPGIDAVGGPQLNLPGERLIARSSGHALASSFGAFRCARRYRRGAPSLRATQLDLSSANLFVTRAAFDAWGPFDERLWPNEETALLRAIERGGGRIAYDPSIVVFHKRRGDLRRLAAQCFGYGRGRARQMRLEGSWPGLGQVLPCLFVLYLAAASWLAAWWPAARWPLAAYAAASAAAAFATGIRHRDLLAVPVLPAVFLVIHVAYATGLLLEAWRAGSGGEGAAGATALAGRRAP